MFTNVLVCSKHLQEYYDNLKCRILFEPQKCCLDLPDNTFGPKLRIEGFGDKGIITGNNKHLLFQRYDQTATLKFSGKKATPTSFLDGCPKHMAKLFKDMVKWLFLFMPNACDHQRGSNIESLSSLMCHCYTVCNAKLVCNILLLFSSLYKLQCSLFSTPFRFRPISPSFSFCALFCLLFPFFFILRNKSSFWVSRASSSHCLSFLICTT